MSRCLLKKYKKTSSKSTETNQIPNGFPFFLYGRKRNIFFVIKKKRVFLDSVFGENMLLLLALYKYIIL